jgi:hypothetical protein
VRHLPTTYYSGLTIVLSNPSRFDQSAIPPKLLSGAAGNYLKYECLKNYTTEEECDIRTADTIGAGLLEGTKGILMLGERAFHGFGGQYYLDNYKLQEQRGYPLANNPWGLPCIASFFPQDCSDIQNYESRFNPEDSNFGARSGNDGEESDEDVKKRGGATSRSNYRFWLKRDTRKLCAKIWPSKSSGIEKITLNNNLGYEFTPILYPSSEDIIKVLRGAKDTKVFLDIETDYPLPQISCVGFSLENSPIIYVVPFHRYNYEPAYGDLAGILTALSLALSRNEIVIHNSQFDLLILAWKYRVLFSRRIYDTMLAQHKCFVDIEKSLGHAASLWTWEAYHKDEGIFNPHNTSQERQLWMYNARDIYTMKLIHKAQQEYAKTVPGLESSINATNSMCYPYLLNTLFGIRYSGESLFSMFKENDRLIIQYIRMLRILLGDKLVSQVGAGSKTHILGSSKQCSRYYHDIMKYPVVQRTPAKEPSLAADALYKLKQKVPNNPTIDVLLKLRERIKESGSLKFTPWIQ